ncbi:hypothetical protein [Lacinutrix sp. MEBiC02404]
MNDNQDPLHNDDFVPTDFGGSTNNNSSTVATLTPKTVDYKKKIIDCLGASLDPDAELWLQSTSNFHNMRSISIYLRNNSPNSNTYPSLEVLAFAEKAMEAMNEGGEVDMPNKIILDSTFVNNVQLKCVYDKLVKDNRALFKSTVGAFINDPKFNLTFKVGNCVLTDDQCTDDSDPFNIVITFEDVNTNPIEMAQAILHESIHAEIARFVKLFQSGVDVNNRSRLFQLYAYYKNYTDVVDPDFNWDNAADHQYIIENYINKIALALRQFDNNRYPLANYKDYAWDGLRAYDYRGVLTDAEENNNINLRVTQTNLNIQVCN